MKRTLSDWATFAEIAASIAVVATLLLVVASMRENTNALQANTYQELMRDMNVWRMSYREAGFPVSDERFAEFVNSETQDRLEHLRLSLTELWGVYEAAFFANERGVLGEHEWVRFERMICVEWASAAEYKYWSDSFAGMLPLTNVLTPAFSAYVEDLCQ